MKSRNFILSTILSLLFVYLTWQLVFSNRGMISLFRFSNKREKLIKENKQLVKEKTELEKKVSRMHSKSLDIDTLDEQARKVLGYGKDNETIFVD